MDQNLKADFGVICKPTELEIVNVCKGLAWVRLKTSGREAHGSTPERGVNVMTKMAKVLMKLEEAPLFADRNEILGQGTTTPGSFMEG